MSYEIALGIAMMFLGCLMTACLTLLVAKVLHWVFEYDDSLTEQYRRAAFRSKNGI